MVICFGLSCLCARRAVCVEELGGIWMSVSWQMSSLAKEKTWQLSEYICWRESSDEKCLHRKQGCSPKRWGRCAGLLLAMGERRRAVGRPLRVMANWWLTM